MNDTIIIAIVAASTVLVLIIAIIVVLAVRGKRQRDYAALTPEERRLCSDESERMVRAAEAKKALSLAVKDHSAGVKAAERALRQGVAGRERALRTARAALAEAESIGTRPIGSYRGREGVVSATETTISVPQGTFPIDGVVAAVDTAGNFATSSRSTFTRVAGGAVLFGPVGAIVGATARKRVEHDLRELYLMVQGPRFATVLTCNPDHGPQVRQFVAAIGSAAQNKQAVLMHRDRAVPAARAVLETSLADTSAVDALRLELERATTDTARIEGARRAVAAASPPAVQA